MAVSKYRNLNPTYQLKGQRILSEKQNVPGDFAIYSSRPIVVYFRYPVAGQVVGVEWTACLYKSAIVHLVEIYT